MSEIIKFSKVIVCSICVLFSCLVLTYPVFGQLNLVSSTPSDGAIDVDTLATFVLVFSAPLDTTARFEEPEDFFLGIELFPADSVGEPEEIIVSSGLDSVTIKNVPLTSDTKFVVLLSGARSTLGEPLDRPYAMTFTTGSTLPTGSVSGTISFPGGDPGGTAVGLFEQFPFGDNGGDPEAAAVVPLSASNYAIDYVPAGTYFAFGFKDVNQDGVFDFPNDAFGGYDADSDNIAEKITIVEGGNLTNIDLAITIPQAVTARQNFPMAENIAQTEFADAALTIVGSDVLTVDGKSQSWFYGFYSSIEDSVFGVSYLGELFFIFTFDNGNGDDGLSPHLPLPKNWIDSDVAADSAEANGGSDFRNMYPDAEVNAFAGMLIIPEMGGTVLTKTVQNTMRTGWSPATQFDSFDILNKNAVSEDTLAVWIFFYSSKEAGQENVILLDVETGRRLESPGPGAPTTASANLDAANQAALSWASDAVLLQVGNVTPDLTPAGFAVGWGFAYYSAAKDSVRAFFLVSSNVTGEDPVSKDNVPSVEALPQGWLDTPVVTPVAEAESNNFRNVHPDATVQALLSRGLLESEPSRAVWRFTYFSAADNEVLFIHLDALTGLVVGVDEAPGSAKIPKSFALEQNFPNPFNPETLIRYQLSKNGEIELTIFNLLGQKVRKLVHEVQPAGTYEVRWDVTDDRGNPVPSGVYFYRLKSGEFVRTKKMIFLQ